MMKKLVLFIFFLGNIVAQVEIEKYYGDYYIKDSNIKGVSIRLAYSQEEINAIILFVDKEDNYSSYSRYVDDFKTIIDNSGLDYSGFKQLALSHLNYDDTLISYIKEWNKLDYIEEEYARVQAALLNNEVYKKYFKIFEDLGYVITKASTEKHGYITKEVFEKLGLEYQEGILKPFMLVFILEEKQ